MNKKQLYESIMTSIAKEVKDVLNESRVGKHQFSNKDLTEIKKMMINDKDFYAAYCKYANIEYYDSYEQSVLDLIDFLENDLYDSQTFPDSEVHAWYILDEPVVGTSWMELKSGKLLNIDNLYMEYLQMIKQ